MGPGGLAEAAGQSALAGVLLDTPDLGLSRWKLQLWGPAPAPGLRVTSCVASDLGVRDPDQLGQAAGFWEGILGAQTRGAASAQATTENFKTAVSALLTGKLFKNVLTIQ